GSAVHLLVSGADIDLLERARTRLGELESRWSRFLEDSELCRVNAAAGRPVRVSSDTAQVVRRSVEAWRVTGGLFDPAVLAAVESAGYDKSFERLDTTAGTRPGTSTRPSPGCDGIEVDGDTVRVPSGVRLDLGGIGKGYAADQVAYELRQAGATGACVNLGGDVRVSGPADGGTGWAIGVTDPFDEAANMTTVSLDEGAVATSSRLRRRWRRGKEELHHLIDPRTGEPAQTSLVAVTVVAAQAHWAEILAKAALIAGKDAGRQLLEHNGLSALLVSEDGDSERVGSMEGYEGWTSTSGGTSPAPAV
ncbi:MAG: FAD:protein FMN transferase, partial [Nocardioidaceae bacterium]